VESKIKENKIYTHEEMLLMSDEEKNQVREYALVRFTKEVKHAFEHGAKKVICGCQTILIRKNKNGIFYSSRNGIGTGVDTRQSSELSDITRSVKENGSGYISYTK